MRRKQLNPFRGSNLTAYRLNHKIMRISGILDHDNYVTRKLKHFSGEQPLPGYLEMEEEGEVVLKMLIDGANNIQRIRLYKDLLLCPCGKWKRTLFTYQQAPYEFKCRECLGLRYACQYISSKDTLHKLTYYEIKYNLLHAEIRQTHYKGKPTRKYNRLMMLGNKIRDLQNKLETS